MTAMLRSFRREASRRWPNRMAAEALDFLHQFSPQLPSLADEVLSVAGLSCPQLCQPLLHGSGKGGVGGKFLQIDPRLPGGTGLHLTLGWNQHRYRRINERFPTRQKLGRFRNCFRDLHLIVNVSGGNLPRSR